MPTNLDSRPGALRLCADHRTPLADGFGQSTAHQSFRITRCDALQRMLDEARTLTEAAERLSARLGVSEDSDRTRVEALEMRRDAMITRARALIAEVKVLARGL